MIRKAKAVWRGTGRAGSGTLSTDSGVLANTPYSFKTRFENEKGTNPEELIAAAHAGCFTMALAFGLQGARVSLHHTPGHHRGRVPCSLYLDH
jgi:lipoyl-dependent peroxiredoxin